MFMRLILIKLIFIFSLFLISLAHANVYTSEYIVSTSGFKIGSLTWVLNIGENNYESEIRLISKGLLSTVYKFEGKYNSKGFYKDKNFVSETYMQDWQTNKKLKTIQMKFNKYGVESLIQIPIEKEHSRVDFDNLKNHNDPVTSFLNLLNDNEFVKVIDGRRKYILKKTTSKDNYFVANIFDYQNMWADHKRNDLKKIEFFIEEKEIFPNKITIHLKKRLFNLTKN